MSGTLNSIYNNVSFALNLQFDALNRLQEQASTGSRVNRASDAPSSAYQILGLNSQGRELTNYTNNLANVSDMLNSSSAVIGSMSSSLVNVKTLITQISSGTYDETARKRTAEGINDILEQIVSSANTKNMNTYLFAGSNTGSAPYVVQRTNGEITQVTYHGSGEERNVEVAPGINAAAFMVGDSIFRCDDQGQPEFTGDTGVKAGTGTSSVKGFTWLKVVNDGSNYKLSIDDGASYVTVPAGGETNQAVTDSRTGQVLYVDTTGITSTGVELVSMSGTHDIFNTLITIRDILANKNGLPDAQLQTLRENSLGALDEVSNLLLQGSVSVGSKIGFLENLKNNLTDLKGNTADSTTRLQEADIAQIAIDISRHQTLYQMSLSVAGKMMSVSLLDFIT
ncbi:MAG: flagellar hook-associated protein FlgL [Planctomycetota bacterium]|nr:flagellar hook-associated protein FlgL [Planctomycetota bacterium]